MEIAIIAVVIIILVPAYLGMRAAIKIVYPKMKPKGYYEQIRKEYNLYDKEWYENLNKKEFYIKSQFGYDIHLTYVKNNEPTEHTIIICHGVTARTSAVIKYLNMFLKNGYNALFIDHRAHGKTGGKKVSYGYYEKYDLAKAIQWVKKHHSGKVGLIGESMGAGISMQTIVLEQVDFLIEDCGYSSFDEEVKHQFRRKRYMPVYPAYFFARLFVYILGGYDVKKVSPIAALQRSDIPVMVVHGDEDNYVPFYMASIVYDNIKSDKKRMFVAEGTRHALAYEEHQEEYQKQVYEFLEMSNLPHS